MNCKKFEKYILLKTEGLSVDEQIDLDKHLSECNDCQNLLESLEKSKMLIEKLTENEPVLHNPGILTIDIIRKIKELEQENQGKVSNLLEKFMNWFFAPFVRPIFVGIAAIMLLGFSYQETIDQVQIAGLENQLSQYSIDEYVAAKETHDNYFLQKITNLSHAKISGSVNYYLQSKIQFRFSSLDKLKNKAKQKQLMLRYLKKLSPSLGLKHLSDTNIYLQ